MDSNHRSRRQQIYSLPPLAAREPLHIKFCQSAKSAVPKKLEPTMGPADYKSAALPIELRRQRLTLIIIAITIHKVNTFYMIIRLKNGNCVNKKHNCH